MKKRFLRILSSLLVVVMIVGSAPLSGFVGLDLPNWADLFTLKADAATESGKCGNNLTWSLDTDTGVLTISGTGDMYNWSYDSYAPWYSNRPSIKIVVIGDSVTSIGKYAFYNCTRPTSVTIGNSVTSIGDDAFWGCYRLKSITIPDSVTSIGKYAFWSCTGLTSVTIGNSVTSIGDEAFNICASLTSITVKEGNTNYSNDEYGVLFNKDKTKLIQYPIGNSRTSFTIPDSVTSIGKYAFEDCYSLTSVTIGNSVTSIGYKAFYNCTGLTSVTIGNSVTSIDEDAFYNCTGLTSVTIPDSVTSIGRLAFWGCTGLTSVTIPDSVTSIGNYAFSRCTGLTSVTISDSVTSISEGVFIDCTGLTSVTIPDSVTSIGYRAFYDCTGLTDVYYTGTEEEWKKISFGSNNEPLLNANIHYNYSFSENEDQSITIIPYDQYNYCAFLGEKRLQPEGYNMSMGLGNVQFDSNKILDISKELNWSSSDESILKVDKCDYSKVTDGNYLINPVVTALKEGNVTITVTASNGVEQSWDVAVYSNEYYLRVYSTDAACSTRVGEKLTLEVALCRNGSVVGDWQKPAIVIGNSDIVDVTVPYAMNSYKGDYFRYEIDVIGLKEGKSSLTITDISSGANVVLTITVGKSLVSDISYMADNVPSFYPDVLGDRKTQTNIYNCNNLYVNSYSSYSQKDSYHVSFDVYNESYMHGAVDVFDSNGKWIESHKIAKYEDIQSLYDTGKALVFLVAELNKPISYTNHMHSVKTHISIDVPKGGYFTISNNYAQSPGAFIYNSVDYMMLAAETAIDIAVNGVDVDDIAQNVVEQAINSDTMMEVFMNEFNNIALSVSQTALEAGYGEAASSLTITAKEIYDSAGISFEGAVEVVCGIAEGVFKLATSFIGATLEGLFVFQKMSSYTMQTVELCNSVNKSYITIHSPEQKESTTINGVTVTDINNAVDSNTVLQVFKIYNDEVLNIVLNDEECGFGDYVLYNISFIKNDKEVQPNGKVTVKIPVPNGYNHKNSTILKETENGWVIIDAVCENGFFVFEIDHFCQFAIVRQGQVNSVAVDDIEMNYKKTATFNTVIDADEGVNYTVEYSSSNPSVVSVDEEGNVYGAKKGSAEITVTVTDEYGNTVTDTCTVTVSYSVLQWIIIIVLFGWIWY